jgi:septum formation protein
MTIILASASRIRADLLRNAGLAIAVRASSVDEDLLKSENLQLPPLELALRLAEAKCLGVSLQSPDDIVIGADQILAVGNRRFDKPRSLDEARKQLTELRGKSHQLISAACCAVAGTITWRHNDSATLTMRDFTDGFLDTYMTVCGADLQTTVGAYKLESLGIQLFEHIDGDYFTILGLPLLPLLHHLRSAGIIAS